jgi:hypothetical protein
MDASVRADYLGLHRRYKIAHPSVGACVLLPFKLPAHQLDFIKRMQLMHVYSTGTQLFTDPATNKPVRCRCTFALWHDAPKLIPASAADAYSPTHSDVPATSAADTPVSSEPAVTKRHSMQTVVYVAGTPAKALFDTGASGGNYISKRYCAINGIKLATATTPISVVGVLQSTADASSCCKLTVRMSALSDTLLFYAIDHARHI